MRKVFIRTFKILIYSFLIVLAITMNCSFAYAAENGPSDRYGSIYIDDGNDAGYIYYNFNKIYKCKAFPGITYNKNNNTLYLNNAHIQKEIIINCMGEDFKVEVSGVNHIGYIKAYTALGMWSCNLNIISNGELIVNEQKSYLSAIDMYGYGKPCNISFGKEIKAKLYAEGKYFPLFLKGNIAKSKEDAINIVPEVTDGASIRESFDSEPYSYKAYYCDFSTKYTFYGVYSKENDSNVYVSLYGEDYTKDNISIYKIEYDTFVNQYVALLVEQGNPYKLGYKKTVSSSGKDYMDNIFLVNEETTFTKCIKDNKEYWIRGYVYSSDDNEVTICELLYDEYLNTYVAVEKEKVPSFKDSEYEIEYKSYPTGDMPGYYIKNNYLEIGYHTHTLAKTDIVKASFTNDGCTEQVYCTSCKYVAKAKRNVPRIKTINISNTTQKHTGEEIKPKIVVTDIKGNRLKEGRDYDIVCSNSVNVGTATAKVVFKGYYSGEKEYNYTITKGILAYSWALWSHNVSQGIELKWCGISKASKYIIRRRTSSSNFKVIKIINNNKVTSYIDTTVKNNNGKGYYYEIEAVKDANYQERKANHFCIRLLKPNLTVSKKNGSIVAKWNKNNNANGYEVMLICGKSKKVYNTKNLSKTLKLAKGKTYKIYVRCYYKNFRDEYYYSEWSNGKWIKS